VTLANFTHLQTTHKRHMTLTIDTYKGHTHTYTHLQMTHPYTHTHTHTVSAEFVQDSVTKDTHIHAHTLQMTHPSIHTHTRTQFQQNLYKIAQASRQSWTVESALGIMKGASIYRRKELTLREREGEGETGSEGSSEREDRRGRGGEGGRGVECSHGRTTQVGRSHRSQLMELFKASSSD
jgi:hypothetical protein